MFLLCSNIALPKNSFFYHRNALKFGIGRDEINSVQGMAYQVSYTRYLANAAFLAVKVSYAAAYDNAVNARFSSQEIFTPSVNLKLNPLVTDRHIISFNIGLTYSIYNCSGNYGKLDSTAAVVFTPYSKESEGFGYCYGANYDFLFSRLYFVSVGVTAIRYNEPAYYFVISLGTVF